MIRADFGPFKTALHRELSEKLPLHTNNPANYGFALSTEDDISYCGLMRTIGNEDRLKELGDEDLRYAPVGGVLRLPSN